MNIKNNLNKVKYYFRRYGFLEVSKKVFKRVFHIKENRKTNQEQYKIWMEKNKLTEGDIERQKAHKFEYSPKISIVVPMYNTNEIFFKELIESLENQTYSNWELCLADGSEIQNENLKQYYEKDEKIKYKFLNENKGISENTNVAIDMAMGEFVGFLDHDDLLSSDALFEMVKAINKNKSAEFIYSDEDKIDEQYERFEPYFKPDYSPETLACNNYITHFVVVKKELIDRARKIKFKI
ncbi:MAG: glycosyltransferase [Clostridia bacterium]|nr:glycosyltransferase [Clostridia bacterium]